jgi:PAS domain S-box-containing protein
MDAGATRTLSLPARIVRPSLLWAAAVFVLLAAATAMGWLAARNEAQDDAAARFRAEAERIRTHVSSRLAAYEQVLRGGVSVFDTWGAVTRNQWRDYVAGLRIADNYPGIQGIGFAQVIPVGDRDAHIAGVRAEGFASYLIRPDGDRPIYSAIVYLEPFDWRNRRAFGFDMLSEPVRRRAMEHARDTGQAAVSGRVVLVQETETDTQPGFLMYLPVYRGGVVPQTIDARHNDLIGYVYSPFRALDLMRAMTDGELRDLRLQVFDGDGRSAEALLFDSRGPSADGEAEPMLTHVGSLALPGHGWTLQLETLPGFAATIDMEKPRLILAAGALVSILVALIVWSLGRSRERLRDKESDFRFLFERNPGPMWVYDLETLAFLEVNEAAVTQYGYTQGEFKRMRITDIRPPEDIPRVKEVVSELAQGQNHSGEWRHIAKDGRELAVAVTGHKITFAGRPASLVHALNVTERRRAEQALRASEAQKGAVIELALDAVIVIDAQGRILEFNPAAERIFGFKRTQVLGREMAGLIIPERDRERHRRGIRRYRETGEQAVLGRRLELAAIRADGTEFPVELTINATHLEGQAVFIGFLRDIADRKAAEAALRESEARLRVSEERYRHVVDLIHEAVWIHREGAILFANASAAALFGAPAPDALIGRSVFSLMHPDDRVRAQERTRLLMTEIRPLPVTEMRLIGMDGQTRIAELHAVPFHQDDTLYVMSAARDVTGQREAEAQLLQAQKMEAVGQLTGGVAHDFNNLLTVIVGGLDLARERAPADMRPTLDGALRAAERGASLVQRLLAYSRKQALAPTELDLNGLATGIEDLLRRTLGEDVDVELTLAPQLWTAMADRGQVENALINLAVNARDAMPNGGKLTIETGNVVLDNDYADLNAEVLPGDYVMLAVTDTGTGMSTDVIERAFEPFFTTKEVGKGSGLGLSMVYGFARQSGGHVKIYSEVGHGTVVRLYLPRHVAKGTHPTSAATVPADHPRGGETIMVVEDDPLVRTLVVTQLKELGYRVLEAGNGPQAQVILLGGEPVDLLFTDVVMPGGMTGRQLADAVKPHRPNMKTLFTSGYTRDSIIHQGKLDPDVHFLSKPYKKQDLAHRVRAVLDGPA